MKPASWLHLLTDPLPLTAALAPHLVEPAHARVCFGERVSALVCGSILVSRWGCLDLSSTAVLFVKNSLAVLTCLFLPLNFRLIISLGIHALLSLPSLEFAVNCYLIWH